MPVVLCRSCLPLPHRGDHRVGLCESIRPRISSRVYRVCVLRVYPARVLAPLPHDLRPDRAHQPFAEVDAFDSLPVRDVDGLGKSLQFRHALLEAVPLRDERGEGGSNRPLSIRTDCCGFKDLPQAANGRLVCVRLVVPVAHAVALVGLTRVVLNEFVPFRDERGEGGVVSASICSGYLAVSKPACGGN